MKQATIIAIALFTGLICLQAQSNTAPVGLLPGATNGIPIIPTNADAPRLEDTNSAPNTNVIVEAHTNQAPQDTDFALSPVSDEPLATNSAAATGTDIQSFRIIADRNIFNANRYPRSSYTRRDRQSESRPVRMESFSLLGTMAYEKGRFAFFDGSSSDYRKVAEPAQTIAGYTITDVARGGVTLQSTNGEQVQLGVGMQMRRHEDEPWRLSSERSSERSSYSSSSSHAAGSSTNPSAASGETNSTGAAASSGGDAESEILKRLLQKREQELNK